MTARYIVVCRLSGHIIGEVETQFPESHESEHARVIQAERDVRWQGAWYDTESGEVKPREPIAVTLDKPVIVADGVDAATISGLPPGCYCVADGILREIDGCVTVSSATPRLIPIIGRGRYAFEVFVEAMTPPAVP